MSHWIVVYLARRSEFLIAIGVLLLAQSGLAGEARVFLSDDSAVIGETTPFRLAQQPAEVPDAAEERVLSPDLPPLEELEALLGQPVIVPGESPGTLIAIDGGQTPSIDGGVGAVPRVTPAAVTRIDHDMLWLSGARSLNEAFDIFAPNLQIISQAQQGSRVGIRGTISNVNDKILMKVNGKLMNDRSSRGVFSELDLAMLGDIHHVDVILGPGSVIDGPGAIAGVINLQTHTGLTFQGLDATVRQGLIEEHTTAEVRFGHQWDDETGLFVYYGMSDYAGADRNDAPYFYSSTFLARDGSQVIAGEPAPAGIPVPNSYQAFRSQVKHKLHTQFTHGNLDIWARLINGGVQLGPQRRDVFDSGQAAPFPGFAGRSGASQGYEQFTVGGSYLWKLSDTFNVDWRLSYDTLDYVITRANGRHRSHREDEVYTRVLGRWTPNDRHSIAFGYAWSHEWFGMPTRGFPNTAPLIAQLDTGNTFPWETDTHSLMAEYQLQFNDRWTGFAGIRTDKHTYTHWLVSPRAALVWTPNERDTLKGIWSGANRRANDGLLRNQFLDFGTFSAVETIESAEMRYERRPCEHWLLAAGFFWQQLNEISAESGVGQRFLGEFQSAGCELEATYRDEDTHFMLSHAYTQLLNGVLARPGLVQGVTAEPYGFGSDLAGWSPHITKLYAAHDLDDWWTASTSLRVYWGFPGDEDLAEYNQTIGNRSLPFTDPGFDKAWRGSYFLDFGLERKFAADRGVARLDLYNVLGWIDRDLNKRNVLRRASWRDEAAALGFSVRWEF